MSVSSRIVDPSFPSFSICSERAEHAVGIEQLYDRCFGPGRYAKTAERLREGNQSLIDMCKVAVDDDGIVVGAVRLWPLQVGQTGRAVFVGPVAVDNKYRGSRLGLILTQECLALATQAGWPMALLIGDEPYFGKLGFSSIATSDYIPPGYVPPNRLLALELEKGALEKSKGIISVPRVSIPKA